MISVLIPVLIPILISVLIPVLISVLISVLIGGWGEKRNREIVFVSFVRACERSCMCPRDDVALNAGLRKLAKSSGRF